MPVAAFGSVLEAGELDIFFCAICFIVASVDPRRVGIRHPHLAGRHDQMGGVLSPTIKDRPSVKAATYYSANDKHGVCIARRRYPAQASING
jgi:hypothetical protein